MTSFTRKQLRATLILPGPNQTFQGTNSNTLVLTDLRMSATLTETGNFTNLLDMKIYGMSQKDMNAVTVLWSDRNFTAVNTRALINLESNDGSGWLQVFQGQFQQASPDYRDAPEVNLLIAAATGSGAQLLAADPTSYPGSASVVSIAQKLAGQMGVTLETNGVSGSLSTPYFGGTLMEQFRQVCAAANIDFYFEKNGGLAITPKNTARQGKSAVLMNKASGMIGYPTIQQYGVNVQCLFSPAIALGCPIQVESDVPGAVGLWYPYKQIHDLEALKPNGLWMSSLDCSTTPAAGASNA